MSDKQATQSRTAKFYDDVLNVRLRELMDGRKATTEEFATAVGTSSSAVRMWYTGYARPDMEKIPSICRFYNVSADWLLGLSEVQNVNMEHRHICKETGLTDNALFNIKRVNEQATKGKAPFPKLTAQEQMWLINRFIEEIDTLSEIANKANVYVNIRNAVESFETLGYDGKSAIEIMKLGMKKIGMTFNFTQGQETADFLGYMCQKHFLDFIEGISAPAYLLKERK